MIAQGDIWWADLGEPVGSAPGYQRPMLIVQGDLLNNSRIATILCVPLTGTQKLADMPGNVLLTAEQARLDRSSVANVSQMIAVDRSLLRERIGHVSRRKLEQVFKGIDIVLGR